MSRLSGDYIHELAPNFQPSKVVADYEDGFIVVLKEVYGQNIHVEGCWFHFSQAVVRKAKNIGLSGAFRDDEHARKCIRCLTCLPLLPADDISNDVTDLEALVSVSNETNKPLLRRLLQYIQHSWSLKATIGPQRLSAAVLNEQITAWKVFMLAFVVLLKFHIPVSMGLLNIYRK